MNLQDQIGSLLDTEIAIAQGLGESYPPAPFHAPARFPEFEDSELLNHPKNPDNKIYGGFRELLQNMGFDNDHLGSASWNPFKAWTHPSMSIVIKPNLVMHSHPMGKEGTDCMLSHASICRPLIDYLLLAEPSCKITICDVPLQGAIWEELIQACGLKDLIQHYKAQGINIKLLDLRKEISYLDKEGVYTKREVKERDPLGYTAVDLGQKSYLHDIVHDFKKLEITDYGSGTVSAHHNHTKNEYLIPNTVLHSELFINLPKLKTHRKSGATLAMKNLVGINGDKSWIAHHRKGVDEYPEFKLKEYLPWTISHYLKLYTPPKFVSWIYKLHRIFVLKGKSRKEHGMVHGVTTMEGNWHGNDTLWRTILDLNAIALYADKKGLIQEKRQRKYLAFVDGIIGMEGEGPMNGTPKKTGVLVGARHPVALDHFCAELMGLDAEKIPCIREGFKDNRFGIGGFESKDLNIIAKAPLPTFDFKPSRGWQIISKAKPPANSEQQDQA